MHAGQAGSEKPRLGSAASNSLLIYPVSSRWSTRDSIGIGGPNWANNMAHKL